MVIVNLCNLYDNNLLNIAIVFSLIIINMVKVNTRFSTRHQLCQNA